MRVEKTSEKIILWLYRENKTQKWLAGELGKTRQSVSQMLKDNIIPFGDMVKIKSLGFTD